MFVNWQHLIDHYKLFWQYPACTEKQFYLQHKCFGNYLGFPWATILDKNVDINQVAQILSPFLSRDVEYYTCCQHIRFRELRELFDFLNIKKVYTPHKCKGEDVMGQIKLHPCPLYAVNIEDESRNEIFIDKDFITATRKYSYSFMGGLQPGYLTDIREGIFEHLTAPDAYIENTGDWHFNSLVYTPRQNFEQDLNLTSTHNQKTQRYNDVLLNSRYSLCPSGTGPNSIRLWESLGAGSIPILLADTLELPPHELWEDAIIRVKESEVANVPDIIKNISIPEEKRRRQNCLKIYNHFRTRYTDIDLVPIVHYCCGSYYDGNFGGVACYDYQVSKVFPHRAFFQGPNARQQMLSFLEETPNPIVITDNHLSCDIPNQYTTILVHHGVAMTHAEREPTWDPYWRDLCCSGQNKMMYYRDPETTTVVSVSKFCSDEFTKYYGSEYKKFKRIDIMHSSEMDEKKKKENFNSTPIVLGNWPTENKGKKIIEEISNISNNPFTFKNLRVLPQGNIEEFIQRKQEAYLSADMFLQLSLSEAGPYATLDAMLCGLPIVASNVGLFYKDVPEECFVKIDWKRNGDMEYVLEKMKYAWENRYSLSKNAREWYMENCRFEKWSDKMNGLVMGRIQ